MATIDEPPAWTTRSLAPGWIQSLYSRFPLVRLEPEQSQRALQHDLVMWVSPKSGSAHPHQRPWASADPSCLRMQLLFLLRKPPVRVSFREWANAASAPNRTLPTLHVVAENRLLPSTDLRSWLDSRYPNQGKNKELQGMPSQEAFDTALALAQVVLGNLRSAIDASGEHRPDIWHLALPEPPQLSAGLTTPIPAALTGDVRDIDEEEIISKGVAALDLLEAHDLEAWALGANDPSPLDALIASHLHAIYALHEDAPLRIALVKKPLLSDYLDRVLMRAGASVM